MIFLPLSFVLGAILYPLGYWMAFWLNPNGDLGPVLGYLICAPFVIAVGLLILFAVIEDRWLQRMRPYETGEMSAGQRGFYIFALALLGCGFSVVVWIGGNW